MQDTPVLLKTKKSLGRMAPTLLITTAMLALVPRMRWRCDWAGHCAAPCATLSLAPHAVRMNVEEPDDELSSVTKLPLTVERRVRFDAVVKFRSIPAQGKQKPVKEAMKTMWRRSRKFEEGVHKDRGDEAHLEVKW